jgi:hypothetical protein
VRSDRSEVVTPQFSAGLNTVLRRPRKSDPRVSSVVARRRDRPLKSISERAPLQGSRSTAEPLHVFTDRSRSGVELHVHADHLELHSDGVKAVRAIWYRHIRRVGPFGESAGEALAITNRGGHVLVVPMSHEHVMQARWLISNLVEWAERSRDRPG